MSDLRFWLMNLVEFSVLFFLFVRGATVSSKMMPQSVRRRRLGIAVLIPRLFQYSMVTVFDGTWGPENSKWT